jgi:hypothetical protein
VVVNDGLSLRIAEDAAGTRFWLTSEEAERAEKEAALRKIEVLEAKLAGREWRALAASVTNPERESASTLVPNDA